MKKILTIVLILFSVGMSAQTRYIKLTRQQANQIRGTYGTSHELNPAPMFPDNKYFDTTAYILPVSILSDTNYRAVWSMLTTMPQETVIWKLGWNKGGYLLIDDSAQYTTPYSFGLLQDKVDKKQPIGNYVTGTPWKNEGYLKSYIETDPGVPAWAKSATKPSCGWSEITDHPTALSSFTNDLGNYGSFVTGTPWTSMGYVTGTPWTGMGYVTGTPWASMGYVTGTPWTGMGYLTANQSISLGGILSGSGTTSITASAGTGYYMPSTSDHSTWDGKQAALVSGTNIKTINSNSLLGSGDITISSNWTTVKVSGSDWTTTGQSLTDITGLSFVATASTTYLIEAWLDCGTSAVTTGVEFGINSTGGSPSVYWNVSGNTSSTACATAGNVANNTADATAFLTTSGMSGFVHIWGIVKSGTGTPTISIRGLKVTSGTLTVRVGSQLMYRVQ